MQNHSVPNATDAHHDHIPVERFIEVKSASAPVYSVDGSKLFFLSNITGVPQVWSTEPVVPWPRQVTFFPDRVMSLSVGPSGHSLCISSDTSGTENAQLFLTDYEATRLQDISQDPSHIYQFGGWSPDGKHISYATNKRNGRDFDLYVYSLETGTHTMIHSSAYTNRAHGFTPDGQRVLMSRSYTNLNNDLFLVNVSSGDVELLTPHDGEVHYSDMIFAKDGGTLYVATNFDSEFSRIAALDVTQKTLTFLTPDDWDAETLALSPDQSKLAYSKNEDGTSRLYVMDVTADSHPSDPVSSLPAGVIDGVAWKPDSAELAVSVNSPRTGAEIWTVDVTTSSVHRKTFAAISGIPDDAFHEPELIHYPTFDDRMIPAYYYVPASSEGPHSVIVYVHGGPESQSRNEFNPILQYFVRQGYAVLVPNVRGSSGYGRTYIHLDDVRKRMDSVADLAKAVEWLTEHGNAHPKKIAVMGRSYGGFMVLAAVTHYPDLWAAGIDIVGIANFRTFMENTSPYRRHLREPEYGTIEADGDFFDDIAPAHRVADITCPMFITHGANDPRVPVSEAEGMVAALQARNHPVQYVRLEDEGHGLVKLKNRILVFGEIANFLAHHFQSEAR